MMELDNKDIVESLPGAENSQDQELLVEDSIEFNRQRKNLSPEEYEEFLQNLAKANKKIIAVKPLSQEEAFLVTEVLSCLNELKAEVHEKRDESVRQSKFIKDKVSALIVSGKVQIHQDEYKKSEESVLQYAGLLDNIVTEIESEINYFSLFISKEAPGFVVAWLSEPDDFSLYITQKIKFIKKYVKSIRKDLNISFSRYNFGFQAQMKRIANVEAFIKYHERTEAAVDNKNIAS